MAISFFSTPGFAQNTPNSMPDSGNVGIGTMSPTSKFQVMGHTRLMSNVKVDSSLTVSDSAKVGQDLKIGGSAYIEGNLNVSGTSNFNDSISLLNMSNSSLSEDRLLVITPQGRISSGARLGDSGQPTSNCDEIVMPFVRSESLDPSAPQTSISLCPMYYDRVGIGSPNPGAKLEVVAGDETGLIVNTTQTGNYGYGILSSVSNNTTKAIAAQKSGQNGDLFVVYGNGNVGVDEDSPDARLDVTVNTPNTKAISVTRHTGGDGGGSSQTDEFLVYGNGHCYAREFTAKLGTFPYPDYVFGKRYQLMPLAQLEKYLQQEHHLPDIPSAKQVSKNGGINLGVMQEKLLKKVEELTLYTIQQQKEIDALKKELKKEN